MSVGLFGAYTGSPRIQRAYASNPAPCTRDALATDDTTLRNALTNPSVTCIEIQGLVQVSSDLPVINNSLWSNSNRDDSGLTIFGTGDDTLDGQGLHRGIRLELSGTTPAVGQDVHLAVSDLTMKDFRSNYGSAIYAYLSYVPHDLFVDLAAVNMVGNTSQGWGGAVYAGAITNGSVDSSAYVTVRDSAFSGNTGEQNGGALWVATEDDTAILDVSSSMFSSNVVTRPLNSGYSYGGAIAIKSKNQVGYAKASVGPGSRFYDNSSTAPDWSYGGAIYTSEILEIAGTTGSPVVFRRNAADAGGAIHIAGTESGSFENATFYDNTAAKGNGGAVSNYGTGALSFSGVTVSDNSAVGQGGGISSTGPVTIGPGSRLENNMATGNQSNGGAISTTSSLTVAGTAADPVLFADDSATSYGGAVFAGAGASITSAVFERNTAAWGGAVSSGGNGLTVTDSTIRQNYALEWGGGVYSTAGPTAFYRSSIVGNQAANGSPGGILALGAPLTAENSFIGGNSAVNDPGGAIWSDDTVNLRFTTVYDDTTTSPIASEISAAHITSIMSVVGNSNPGDVMQFGTLDDSYSVSTSSNSAAGFNGDGSDNLPAGQLGLGQPSGSGPGGIGITPSAGSPLVLAPLNGLAPLFNPLPGITTDQRGFARIAPFTIGARQALTINSVTPASGDSAGGELVTIHGSAFTGATSAAIGGAALTNLTVVDDTTLTGIAPAGNAGTADVTVSDASGTATLTNGFTFVTPTPNPPGPTPSNPASAPREVRAEAGVESATASWLPPTSTGSFPVTSYQAVASPGGQACMVSAPRLECTITGLTAGTTYTVTARALTGAGWGQASTPGAAVVPLAPPKVPTILITNSRDRATKSIARVEGTTTGLVGAEVVPYLRAAGQNAFTPGNNTRTVDADGKFVWQRKAKKRFTVYFTSGNVTSNRLVIRPE